MRSLAVSKANAIDYLISELPSRRKRYTWAPRLYALELAHIDAITGFAKWARSQAGAGEEGLSDVIDAFARVYGWTPESADS
jgi:hypothetical protein